MRPAVWKLQEPGTRVCINMDLKTSAELSGSVDTEEAGVRDMASREHTSTERLRRYVPTRFVYSLHVEAIKH